MERSACGSTNFIDVNMNKINYRERNQLQNTGARGFENIDLGYNRVRDRIMAGLVNMTT